MASLNDEKPTVKRDFLIGLETAAQKRWAEEKIFETNAPDPNSPEAKQEKWFGNFPYPYMNGSLHLGHAFTISKIEFAAGYQRMLGKRVLFPMGFHCTGMPIKASSDKIIREMEMFGSNFENYQAPAVDDGKEEDVKDGDKGPVDKAKKGKIQAKDTGLTYQFQIMQSIGVPTEEIKKFADPYYWLTYFPPIAKSDCTAFGARIDWRQSFITTDANPYYDSFVRWQQNKLYAQKRIKFGERYTIYSPKDGQPCMDHDRSEGEGGVPVEYTAVKMEVLQWSESAAEIKSVVDGKKVYMVAATLRPETMYGQTNCFVGTTIPYGLFAISPTELILCTQRAARNMAFQGIFPTRGEFPQVATIEGAKLLGTKVKAPLGIAPEVYVLPMEGVLPSKGTGVVTSVPSDSPDDYATLMDLRRKAEYYKIDPSWASIDPIAVLSTPTYGDMTAPALCEKLKIRSQKDKTQLTEAKEIAYKEGFYSGVMLVGEFKGEKVEVAKGKVREKIIGMGLGWAYAEPDKLIISRSTDECVVALMDQWYLDYGEEVWRDQTKKLLAKMETYGSETRNGFEATLDWLAQWACARTYGLGSKLPWDPQFLVESLSDSTIYMAYYTVANLLQGGVVDGSKPGPLGITPDQLTDEVWEYILLSGPTPTSTIPIEKLNTLRSSFNYFYPMDVRSSGKDLIPNHLTFALYAHAAIFPPEQFPLSMRTNGHLMLGGKKMSKSTGNFLTMRDAVLRYGADATRIALADAGDGIEDANFSLESANAAILRLHTIIEWCDDMVKNKDSLRNGERSYHDNVFETELRSLVNATKTHYEATNYKDALKYGFFELQAARDWYREVTLDVGMHADLVLQFIRLMVLTINPIAPHFAEHLWVNILNEPKTVQHALWPKLPPVEADPSNQVVIAGAEPEQAVLESGVYMRDTLKTIRDAETALLRRLTKSAGKKPKAGEDVFDPSKDRALNIFVASRFPDWQDTCVSAVQTAFNESTGKVDDAVVRKVLEEKGLMKDKRAMPFVQLFKKRITQFGPKVAFNRTLAFSEAKVLTLLLPYLKKSLKLEDVSVYTVDESKGKDGLGFNGTIADGAEPGQPAFVFYNKK